MGALHFCPEHVVSFLGVIPCPQLNIRGGKGGLDMTGAGLCKSHRRLQIQGEKVVVDLGAMHVSTQGFGSLNWLLSSWRNVCVNTGGV